MRNDYIRLVVAFAIGFALATVPLVVYHELITDWRGSYYALAAVCDNKYMELGRCKAQLSRCEDVLGLEE